MIIININLNKEKKAILQYFTIVPALFASRKTSRPASHIYKPLVIYQTRATVYHWDIQTAKKELKIRRAAEFFLNQKPIDNV